MAFMLCLKMSFHTQCNGKKKSTQIRSPTGRCFNSSKIIKSSAHSHIFKNDQAQGAPIIVFLVLLIDFLSWCPGANI